MSDRTIYLQKLVTNSGGSQGEYNLFAYLMGSSFTREYKDYRIGRVLTLLLPVKIHAWSSYIFWQHELQLATEFNLSKTNVYTAWQMLSLLHQVNGIPYGDFLHKYLTGLESIVELNKIRDSNLNIDLANSLEENLLLLNLNSTNYELLINLVDTNNKAQTALLLANHFNYSEKNIIKLTHFFESWQFS